ncbi:hypothetical protein RIF29_30210 [Crotalaria pallida]|uniref:Uncharacterized protein n=1 Tax=Crotalaria pallida TaxID=3830 RepID=A0AAN9EG64_CROPI
MHFKYPVTRLEMREQEKWIETDKAKIIRENLRWCHSSWADEEPVDQEKYLEESCKPKCVKPLLDYEVSKSLLHLHTLRRKCYLPILTLSERARVRSKS